MRSLRIRASPASGFASARISHGYRRCMLTETEVLDRYLAPPLRSPDGVELKSSFWAALLDARAVTGRDGSIGQVVRPVDSRAWIGAIGYLCFMDQVGTAVFRPSVGAPDTSAGILRALESFTGLSSDERDAIYALRNALAHDYSLINTDPRKEHDERSHRFQLHPQPGELAALPARRWNGSFAAGDLAASDDTIVSLREVGDLAEQVAAEVFAAHAASDLRIGLAGGADEMLARYFMQSRG